MNYLILINKQNGIPKDYVPNNLVLVKIPTINNQKIYLEKKTYKQIKLLLKDMNKIFPRKALINSGYRPSFYQENLLNDLIKLKGEEALMRFAPPGHSEHQTGLAVDLAFLDNANSKIDDYQNEYEWISDNAHKYGFIIRYPRGKEKITGYNYEPWHLRYIGDDAKILYKYNLTLEEYHEMFI